MAGTTTVDDIVDKRSLHIKPCKYKGNENEWATWRFVFRNFLTLVESDLIVYMDQVEEMDEELSIDTLAEGAKASATRVYAILSQFLEGPPLRQLMLVKKSNGLEAWRLLCKRYEPRSGQRSLGALQAVLNSKFEGKDFAADINEWEALVEVYEKAAGEELGDSMRIALVVGKVTHNIQNFVLGLTPPVKTYRELKEAINTWLQGQRKWQTYAGPASVNPDAMDIGFIKGKNKGKCKGNPTTDILPKARASRKASRKVMASRACTPQTEKERARGKEKPWTSSTATAISAESMGTALESAGQTRPI